MNNQNLWTYRGYLPHFHCTDKPQFITYRLADSLPIPVVEKTIRYVEMLPERQQQRKKIQLLEKYLDQGCGCCVLQHNFISNQIIENWNHFDGKRYDLLEWVVMPNHVHILFQMHEPWTLGQILHSWKSYTGNLINAYLSENKNSPLQPVWQREYWDRYIRGENHFRKVVDYIHMNPVKAGLCQNPEDYKYSSAYGAPSARRHS